MEVIVMNRSEAIRYSYRPHDEISAIVSIATPSAEYDGTNIYRSRYNKIHAILRLQFDDVEDGNDVITIDDAKKIHSFIEANKNRKIIVHCDAGISRSAGIAAALMKHYNGDDTPIFNNPKYVPNMKCYRTMLEELMS